MSAKHNRYDAMTFPPYEFRAYPKMLYFPRKLPAGLPDASTMPEGSTKKDANGYDLAVIRDGKWEAVPFGVAANSAAEEAHLLAHPPRQAEPTLTPEDEIAALREKLALLEAATGKHHEHSERDALVARAGELGIAVDKRWGIEKLRHAIEQAA